MTRIANKIDNSLSKNIRATALEEFWGTEFEESVYLWEGAKHRIPLNEWDKVDCPTLKDRFSAKEDIRFAHDYCKEVYHRILPRLAAKLNEIHQLDHPVYFWEIICARWLFEHICIVYEKYSYLSNIDLENTDIVLLDKDSFYIPKSYNDFWQCFSSDFGVQQLVSHYYYLFVKKKFPSISKEFESDTRFQRRWSYAHLLYFVKQSLRNSAKSILPKKQCKIILQKTYIHRKYSQELIDKSDGKIQHVRMPKVEFFSDTIDYEKREKLLDIEVEKGSFEQFLLETFYYGFPRSLIEYFDDCYRASLTDIKAKRFDYIVSEKWVGDFATAIYVAIAKLFGKKLIFTQHGAFTQLYNTNVEWLWLSVADIYLTTGWKSNHPNVVEAGLACREITDYQYHADKKNILYICNAWVLYLVRFMNLAVGNSISVKKLEMTRDFIEFLPDSLSKHFVLRNRPLSFHWDAEHFWQISKRNIRMDDIKQNLLASISKARIVVIDHFSTSFAEILTAGVPCIIIHDQETDPLADEYKDLFDELACAGVVHYSAQSAVSKLTQIYDNIRQWWESESVRKAVDNLKSKTIGQPSKTTNYLMSLV
ncbi:MAG: LIC12162 family protein [Planctomycetes bacterium]|nr:LIC12162 family protein [Planctomycetota bacterium]